MGERLCVEMFFARFFCDFTKWLCMGRGDAQCDEKTPLKIFAKTAKKIIAHLATARAKFLE